MIDFFIYLLLTLPLIGAYAMLALGIVVIFRASKVLNLAHGAMAMAPAYLVYTLSNMHVPVLVALPVGVAFGALLGVATERLFVRPLRKQGPTAQTVGTVAVFGLVVSIVAKIYGTTPLTGARLFPEGGIDLSGSTLQWTSIGLFLTALGVAAAFVALFKFTNLGLMLRGAADNRVAASLVGINPDRSAVTAWLIGGGLAGLSGVLLGGATSLSPYSLALQMLPAFVAALIGGLGSITGALVGAALVGMLTGLVPAFGLISVTRTFATQLGMPQLVLTIVALVTMYLRGGRYSQTDIREEAAGATDVAGGRRRYRVTPEMRQTGKHRLRNYACLIGLLALPFVIDYVKLGVAVQACLFVIAAASIVLLTGWVGQISLAQAAFVGIGGYGSALIINSWHVPFPLNLIGGALIAAGAAAALGVVALRVRGLYLAVATLIFAYMADSYLFSAPWFAGTGGTATVTVDPIGSPGTFPYFDLSERRTFYFVALAVAATVLFAMANLRDSKTGRAFFAVRGSETAAASLGIDVRRYKLVAFALAGGIAGLAGNLQLISKSSVVTTDFEIKQSLLFLAIAVVGGLQSRGGLVASAILFASLEWLFYERADQLAGFLDVVSAALLAVVLLVYPGGLAQLPSTLRALIRHDRLRSVREQVARVRARVSEGLAARTTAPASAVGRARVPSTVASKNKRARLAEPELKPLVAPGHVLEPRLNGTSGGGQVGGAVTRPRPVRDAVDLSLLGEGAGVPPGIVPMGVPVLDASGISVVFGGLVAVDNASLHMNEGEIVGLIGPNGAGKTTLFNAISGLNRPTTGTVHLFGEDVTDLEVHERAQRGLGRTFQAIQLFPQLSVYENLLVATHANNGSGLFSHVALTRRGLRHEAASEDVVRKVVAAMGLEPVADRTVGGLPFGVLRQVEIARTVVTGSPVVMLDEPASGLDNAETDRLSELLYGLRDNLGITLLLIEHDVRMVTEVTDRMYVLVYGKIVASGTPDEVRNDPVVTAAYLGEPAPAATPEPEQTVDQLTELVNA